MIEMGCKIEEYDDSVRVIGTKELKHTHVKTLPYPGFPTDMQPQITATLALSQGTSIVTESIFENRFKYVDELSRMGANIKVEGNTAIIDGVDRFTGARVSAPDLRAGAALVIAGLAAEGDVYKRQGRMRPVTEYQVGGRSYKAARHFRGYVVKSRNFGKNIYRGKGAYVSEKDYVHVTLGRITNLRAMAEELWPLGSEMTVYYNPDNPKQAFVERLPVKAAVEGIIFIWTGAGIMLLSVLMLSLIHISFIQLEDGRTDGFCNFPGNVFGTYLHGIFDSEGFLEGIFKRQMKEKGIETDGTVPDLRAYREEQYDKLAALIRESLNMEEIYRILERGAE